MTPRTAGGLSLIGYRGTGKTTVGRLVAERLGWPFLDADEELERAEGRRISEIFRDDGEAHFRELERRTIGRLTAGPRAVLATGGGAILDEENRRALKQFGPVVWLSTDPLGLAERLRNTPGDRPALTPAGLIGEISDVLEARTPLYQATADIGVTTGKRSAIELAEEVLSLVAIVMEDRR